MKFLLAFLFLVFAVAACKKKENGGPQNTSIICFDTASFRTNIQEYLHAISFVDGKSGFVAGNRGGIYKTTDSAKTWTSLNSTVSFPIYDLFFTNSLNGFAVGGQVSCSGAGCISPGGFILKTTNGGQTWANVYTPSEKIEIVSVYFVNSNLGFCVGKNIVMKTTNGGQTWNEYKVNSLSGSMLQIRFANEQQGYIVCYDNVVLITNNGGQTWTISNPIIINGYFAVATTPGAVYAAGQGGIIKSTNKGNSWALLPNSPNGIRVIQFFNDNTGFAVGSGNYSGGDFGYSYGAIYCTDNGGLSWNGAADVKTGDFSDISFPSDKIGYAICSGGYYGSRVMRFMLK